MQTVIRNVEEIDVRDRQALEHVLGQELSKNQQLVIRIISLQVPADAAHTSSHSDQVEWTEANNARRCQLIDKKLQGLIMDSEAGELANLQEAMREYVSRVAPLPLDAAKQLHADLVEKQRAKKP